MKPLLDPQKPETVRSLLKSVFELHETRSRIQREQEALLEGMNGISLPDAISKAGHAVLVRSGVASAQIQLQMGLLSENERARVYSLMGTMKDRTAAQTKEDWANALYPMLEVQYGEVRQHLRYALCVHGYAVDVQEYLPADFASKMPNPSDYGATDDGDGPSFGDGEKAKAYGKAREVELKRMGTPSGEFCWRWRAIDPKDFFWLEDNGRLTLAVERQFRYLKDLLEDERYAESLPKLRSWYYTRLDERGGSDKDDMLGMLVQFLVVEDRHRCLYYVLPTDKYTRQTSKAAPSFARDYAMGEIVDSYPNELGRIKYTFTPGLTSTSRDPAYRYRGVFRDMTPLIEALDFYLSVKATRIRLFSFPQPIRNVVPVTVSGTDIAQSTGGGKPPLQLEPGSLKVIDMDPGESLVFMAQPEVTADEVQNIQFIQAQLDQLGIARSVKDSSGIDSGYQLEILNNNALATRKPLLRGIRQAHVHRVSIGFDIAAKQVKETLYLAGSGTATDRQGAWLTLTTEDVDTPTNTETIFNLVRPNQAAQNLDAFARSTSTKFADRERSRELFGGLEDSERIEDKLLEDLVIDNVQPFLVQAASMKVQATIEQLLQKRNRPTLQDLQGISPGLAALFQQRQAFPGQDNTQYPQQPPPDQQGAPPVVVQPPGPTMPPGGPQVNQPQAGPPGPPLAGGTPAGSAPVSPTQGNRMSGGISAPFGAAGSV